MGTSHYVRTPPARTATGRPGQVAQHAITSRKEYSWNSEGCRAPATRTPIPGAVQRLWETQSRSEGGTAYG